MFAHRRAREQSGNRDKIGEISGAHYSRTLIATGVNYRFANGLDGGIRLAI